MLVAQQLAAIISLWLAGVALRMTILAIPPVITLIRDDLNLSPTQVGVLTGLPVSLFAIAAVIGSLLIARLGARPSLLIGLFTTAIGSALRSASTEVAALYATTTLMALGVAIMQPALPPLVRSWLPARIGFGTAVYTNGLLAGEIAPVVITPFVLPLIDTSWRFSLVVWSLPVLAIAIWIATLAPREYIASTTRSAWWPDWSSGLVWRLGLIFGSVTSTYFTINGFLPLYLNSVGRPDLIKSALIAQPWATPGILSPSHRRASTCPTRVALHLGRYSSVYQHGRARLEHRSRRDDRKCGTGLYMRADVDPGSGSATASLRAPRCGTHFGGLVHFELRLRGHCAHHQWRPLGPDCDSSLHLPSRRSLRAPASSAGSKSRPSWWTEKRHSSCDDFEICLKRCRGVIAALH
jgi:MFS family permease